MNTPETEAVLGLYNDNANKVDLVLAHFARRLERERDEARVDLQHAHKKTGKMALLEGRRFIGIERDPDYFRVASERISSAKTAKLTDRREKTP